MSKKLKYLHLEDEKGISNLVRRMIERNGYDVENLVVESKKEFLDALENQSFDLVIADYSMSDFDGLSALKLLRERDQETSFILFSGSIGEEKAIQSLREGATDYVLKQNIKALIPAINRAVNERNNRVEKRRAQQELEQTKYTLSTILDNLPAGVLLIDKETRKIKDVNPKAAKLVGLSRQQIIGQVCHKFICPSEQNKCPICDLGQEVDNRERVLLTANGNQLPVLKSVLQITMDHKDYLLESFVDISRQKEVEKEVTAFGRILDNSLNEIYIFDAISLKFIKLNRGAKENIGYDEQEIARMTPVDIKPEFTKASFDEFIAPLRSGEKDKLDFSTIHKRKDGTTYPIDVSLQMDTYENKRVFVAFISDITERKRAENIRRAMFDIAAAAASLRDENEFYSLIQKKLSTLLNTSNFIIAMYNKDKDTLAVKYMQDKMDRIEQFQAIPARDTVSAYVVKSQKSLLLDEQKMAPFFRKHDIKWVGTPAKSWMGVPLIVHNESIGLIILQSYDRAGFYGPEDLKLMEFVANQLAEFINLKELESKMYRLFRSVEQSPVITVITDLKGNIQYVNPKFCQVTGYSCEEAIGQNPRILKSGETPASEYKTLWDTISGGHVWRGRFHNKKKNGQLYWEDATIGPIKNEKGETTHYLAIKEDITEQVEAQRRMNRLNRQNEILIASFPSILMVVDRDDRIIRWNKTAEEVFGLPWKEVRHKYLKEVPLSWNWEDVTEGISVSREKKKLHKMAAVAYERRDGAQGFLDITVAPFIGREEIIDGYLIHAEEVTEKKVVESQKVQAQKLESIGQLAAGIAHEINTPAQYVGDNIHFLKDSFADLSKMLNLLNSSDHQENNVPGPSGLLEQLMQIADQIDLDFLINEIPQAIQQSQDGIEKIGRIVSAMKEFSHPGGKNKTLVDLNRNIENTITVSRNEWKYVAELQTEFDESLTEVYCYPDELNQVILNLIINAAHAIKEKVGDSGNLGKIKIITRNRKDKAQILIVDDGPGIPAEIQKKIFDPFFTTKDVGKGTGQGLAIAYDVICNKHGGELSVKSKPGEGATFIVELPKDSE